MVEDEEDIQELLKFFLEDNDYQTMIASDGIEAIDTFHRFQPDMILLDIMIPKIDGYAVCELIRKESKIPIIMITALSDETNQLKGFDLLIDDYVTKPFSMPILLRKIQAIFRRIDNDLNTKQELIQYKDIVLNMNEYTVSINKEFIDFTRKEFEILKELLAHPGYVQTREMLLDKVWQYEYYDSDRVVDNHIKNIRKKLGKDYIKTVKGIGYKVEKD
ncbi:MAG: response regulator transcription factor [Beduini sp.]